MGLIDSIIGVESGGNPNARNPRSSASGLPAHVRYELRADALVRKLFFARGPSAVLGRVVAIVVDAVKRVLFAGARPHVGIEVLERCPSITNLNAARSIVFVGSVLRKKTSAAHAIPNLVFGRRPAAALDGNRHAVGSRPLTAAPTAGGIAGPKVGDAHNPLFAAVANAKQSSGRGASVCSHSGFGFRRRGQLPELHANAIYGGGH